MVEQGCDPIVSVRSCVLNVNKSLMLIIHFICKTDRTLVKW